jgi:hypothetical protein
MPFPNLKELGNVIQVAKTFDIAKVGFLPLSPLNKLWMHHLRICTMDENPNKLAH